MKMRISRSQHLTVFSFAAIHLLLFSICPVSSRIYRTKDAVVIEVDDLGPSTFASHNFRYPPPIPMTYAANPYMGFYSQQQQPHFPFWPYPLYKPASSVSAADVENVTAFTPESKQQKIACGVGPTTLPKTIAPAAGRIFGGTEAIKNSWPFLVGLKNIFSTIICGGSIISKTRILTAASCVNTLTMYEVSTTSVLFVVHNEGSIGGGIGDAQMVRRVARVVYHIDFNMATLQNDVAVLTIDPPINYSKDISPVCLPPASSAVDQFVGKDAAIMGWGWKTSDYKSKAQTLQQATVQVTSNAKCSESWSASPSPVSNQQICASADGKDICTYDNGGPMVAQTKDGSTSWTQVGIASFGNKCAGGKPMVFASVAFFRKWIDTYVRT